MTLPTIADALASSLSRIEAGEDVAAVLTDHPAHAKELRTLIQAAMAVRTHRPAPSPAFRASLLDRLETLPPTEPIVVIRRPAPRSARVWVLRTAAALAASVVAFSGLAVASANSLPGDVLYPVRRGVERVHDAADRVAPPIGRAIDYLTIRTVPDDPALATPQPTAALAPGSSLIERPGGAARPRNTVPPPTDERAPATEGRRALPNPGVIVVGADATSSAAVEAAADQTARAGTNSPATAAAADGERAQPTATNRRGETPSPAPAPATPSPVAPSVVPSTRIPDGAPGTMSGLITGHDGSGLPGAMVSVYPIREDGEPRWSHRVSMRTQLDGSYAFGELPAGRYKMAVGELHPWVWRVWYKDTVHVQQAEPIVVQPGLETDGIDVRLRRSPWSFGGWGGPSGRRRGR